MVQQEALKLLDALYTKNANADQGGQQDIENPLPYTLDDSDKQVENPFPPALTPEQALADACAAEAVH
ncbi:hypothetical protein [Comamonas kerstersii]|uniref:hypothetical protein n=1 Tax=Comamonas kerstersii TaxID=225992 RepID=UPI0026DDA2F5|nr:hypothetical protein [Comamonas kerstersii]